ncbi:unnamed protein product, partial [Symbiodinium necroappetens]
DRAWARDAVDGSRRKAGLQGSKDKLVAPSLGLRRSGMPLAVCSRAKPQRWDFERCQRRIHPSCRALLFLCTFAALASAATDEELRQAVLDRDQDTVQELIASGRVNVSDVRWDGGRTPLHQAVLRGQFRLVGLNPVHEERPISLKIVELLLAAWPDGTQAVNNQGETPLHLAVRFGSIRSAELLLAAWPDGAQATDKTGRNPFTFLESAQDADCNPLIYVGCNGTSAMHDHRLQEAAVHLECSDPYLLSKPSLELWLQCGGDARWRSALGKSLVDIVQDPDAQTFLKGLLDADLLALTLKDWRTWLIPSIASIVAGFAVLVEQRLQSFRWGQREQRAENAEEFLEGATMLVARACGGSWLMLRKLWRWMEALVTVFIFGWALLWMNPQWWVPLVTLAHFLPAACLHGPKEILRVPVRALVTTDLSSQAIAFARTAILIGIFLFMTMVLGGGWAINPLFMDWYLYSDVAHSWLSDHLLFRWCPDVTGDELAILLRNVAIASAGLYMLCLLGAILFRCAQYAQCFPVRMACRRYTGPSRSEQLTMANNLLLKEKAEFNPAHLDHPRIKVQPVSAWAWPWQAPGLYQSVALMLLDVGLDANTIGLFLFSQDYFSALVMTFVVARSCFKQMCLIPPWRLREAMKASVRRGILRQDVLDFLAEEQRSEAFFCACVTAYSAWFNARTAGQLLLQFLSAFLSMYMFAGYVVQSVDKALPTQPEGTHADVANDLVRVVGHPTLAQEVDEISLCVIPESKAPGPSSQAQEAAGPEKVAEVAAADTALAKENNKKVKKVKKPMVGAASGSKDVMPMAEAEQNEEKCQEDDAVDVKLPGFPTRSAPGSHRPATIEEDLSPKDDKAKKQKMRRKRLKQEVATEKAPKSSEAPLQNMCQ